MISEMIDKLIADAAAEASHKAFCDKEMGESQEKIADHQSTIEKFSPRVNGSHGTVIYWRGGTHPPRSRDPPTQAGRKDPPPQ